MDCSQVHAKKTQRLGVRGPAPLARRNSSATTTTPRHDGVFLQVCHCLAVGGIGIALAKRSRLPTNKQCGDCPTFRRATMREPDSAGRKLGLSPSLARAASALLAGVALRELRAQPTGKQWHTNAALALPLQLGATHQFGFRFSKKAAIPSAISGLSQASANRSAV